MPLEWTIKGEEGKAVDDTARSLEEMKATGAVVSFGSLGGDSLRWTVALKDIADGFGLIPEEGQRITLYRNGERYFTGWVTVSDPDITATDRVVNIVVEGPWWWLEHQPISNDLPDQTGATAERTAYVFATGNVKNHLQGLTTRAIAMGAPIRAGSIADVYNVPRLSLRNIHYSEAYAQLMRWVPDGIAYLDYTGDDSLFPALCMQRRDDATTVTIDPSNGCVPKARIKPRLDLRLYEVKVMSATRVDFENKRLTKWVVQSAGTPNPAFPGRQIITTSGPELDTFIPQDFTDAAVVRSTAISSLAALILNQEPRLRAGGVTGGFSVGAYSDDEYTLPSVDTQLRTADGRFLPSGYDYYLNQGEPKDWWTKDGWGWRNARLTCTIYSTHTEELPLPSSPYSPPVPEWFQVLGGTMTSYNMVSPGRIRWVWSTQVSVPFIAVNHLWASDTTLIRQEDYGFIHPPTDLAANLLAAQSWVPYVGSISTVVGRDNIPAGHLVGAKLNMLGVLPKHETMGALISAQTVALKTGEITYELGAPARLSFLDLVSQFRQQGADNIEWLSSPTPVSPPSVPDDVLETPGGDNLTTPSGENLLF